MSTPELQLDPIAGDPLMSVEEVARWLGVAPTTIVAHVAVGLRSLDEGDLIVAGDWRTPVIRSREVRRFMKEQFEMMRLRPQPTISEDLIENTPVLVAYAFVIALQEEDRERVWEASSAASREAFRTPETLMSWWADYLDIGNAPEPGVTSGVYSIGERAVAVKYIADTPASGGVIQRPTMVNATPLALVEDPDGWRIDQPLQSNFREWGHLAGAPPRPEPDSGASGPS